MTESATNPGRRNWMKQAAAIDGGVARATMIFENEQVLVKSDPDGEARPLVQGAQRS